MGFYADHIFPRLMDWTMRSARLAEERRTALATAQGHVLELGFGTGLNLPYYPPGVTRVTAVEPAVLLPARVRARIARAEVPVDLRQAGAERLPYEPHTFDCVVSTWTLCTIPDVALALREARRVLRPGGRLLFLEHGRSDDPRVARWQDRLTPLQRRLACGCHLNRPIDRLVGDAGFTLTGLSRYRLPGCPGLLGGVLGSMYRGIGQVQLDREDAGGSKA